MQLVPEFGPIAVAIVEQNLAVIGVNIFAASDPVRSESILGTHARGDARLYLVLPDDLFAGIASLLNVVGEIGGADSDRSEQQQTIERIAETRARRSEHAEFDQCRIVVENVVVLRCGRI